MPIDVVIQGPVYPETVQVIEYFESQPWAGQIILSTWSQEDWIEREGNYVIVHNRDVANPGVGNRNRHIVSSLTGLRQVRTENAIKARSDQIIQDLPKIYEFFQEHQNNWKIFTLGLYRNYPFHPRDHFFMGPTKNLLNLFDCPLDKYQGEADYTKIVRAETWIGSHYYAFFDKQIRKMTYQPQTYLVDGAPKHNEAMAADWNIRHLLFASFPRIQMAWPKHGLTSYHYDVGERHSEYWHEDSITV